MAVPLNTILPLDGRKENDMSATLAFEIGFDWNIHPIQGVRDGVFPLQLCLVDDAGEGTVLSPCHPSAIEPGDTLLFRVYDFTDYGSPPEASPEPSALQVLFTSASTIVSPPPPFSPVVDDDGMPLAQLASITFPQTAVRPSIAYGVEAPGWAVEWSIGVDAVIQQPGRFKFRALLTVGTTGEMARFYRVDPEMVVGDPGGGGNIV